MKIEKEMHFELQICPCLEPLCPSTQAIQTILPNEFDKTLLNFFKFTKSCQKGKTRNSNSKKNWEIMS